MRVYGKESGVTSYTGIVDRQERWYPFKLTHADFIQNGAVWETTVTVPAHSVCTGVKVVPTVTWDSPLPSETLFTTQAATNYTPTGYTISASGEFNSNYAAWKAFDKSSAAPYYYWQSNDSVWSGTPWIKIQVTGQPRMFTSITATRATTVYPTEFLIQGCNTSSNNDVDWTTLRSVIGFPAGQPYNFTTTGLYSYYRLRFTAGIHGNYVGLNTLDFYERPVVPPLALSITNTANSEVLSGPYTILNIAPTNDTFLTALCMSPLSSGQVKLALNADPSAGKLDLWLMLHNPGNS